MTELPVERAPVTDPAKARRSSDLIVQASLAFAICTLATGAAIAHAVTSETLAAVYTGSLTYIFGVGNGVRIARNSNDA